MHSGYGIFESPWGGVGERTDGIAADYTRAVGWEKITSEGWTGK